MAQHLNIVVFLICFFISGIQTTSYAGSPGPHVADVNILLPPRMSQPVEYLLIGSDGCFKWSWDHHDILSVVPEYNSSSRCSTRARVRSIAPYSGRKETSLYATDINSGVVIRCKVFIDNIAKIRISHNSVKLDLDGLAILRVRGFDDQDNEFSSLVGLKFMWRLLPQYGEASHYLAHVPLRESPLSDCGGLCGDLNVRVKLEENGYFSDLYVVKGVGIGEEKISVAMMEKDLSSVSDTINLTVVEAMLLEPSSPVFVIIGASLQYNLKVIRQNLPQAVALPSAHHKWFSINSSVVVMDNAMGLARALSIGVSSVFVEDIRVSKNIIESCVHVVVPQKVYFYATQLQNSDDPVDALELVSSLSTWYVIAGCRYMIRVKVVSEGPQPHDIYITESDDLRMHNSSNDYWKIMPLSDNGLRDSIIFAAVSQGNGRITASLGYFDELDKIKKVIVAEQDVRVCNPIRYSFSDKHVKDGNIHLPWAPNVFQTLVLKTTGGCGDSPNDFVWSVSDSSVLTVTAFGVVKAIKPGISTVKVASVSDSSNFDEVIIEVSIPSSMIMLRNFPMETVVGSHLRTAVTMRGSNGEEFHICDAFHPFIKWMTSSQVFMVVNNTDELWAPEPVDDSSSQRLLHPPPCSWTRLAASSIGQTLVQATLSKDFYPGSSLQPQQILLKASMSIAAYLALTVHQVGDGNKFGGYSMNYSQEEGHIPKEKLNNLFLTPGTTMDIVLLGGPQRWGKGIEFVEAVKTLDDNFMPFSKEIVTRINEPHNTLYRVSCSILGTFYLVFERGNLIGEDHPLPALSDATLAVACKVPSTIALIVDEPENKKDLIKRALYSGAVNTEGFVAGPVAISNGRSVRIAAVGVDISGNAFANSSSLTLRWELTGCDNLAYWDDHVSRAERSSWERELALLNNSGECIVRASASAFIKNADAFNAEFSKLDAVAGAVRIQVVTALRVDPDFSLIYFSPFAKENLSIVGGSCFLETAVNNSNVIGVAQPTSDFQCSKVVLFPKGLGTALVTVSDVGLIPPVAVSSVVRVADIDWIKIVADDEISLMEGYSNAINIIAGTSDGLTFDSSQYAYMKIHIHVEDDIVDVESCDTLTSGCFAGTNQSFMLIAKHIGVTSIYISAMQLSGHEVLSQTIKIEVYSTPKIFPEDIFLAPGATYTVIVQGGPTVAAYVEYVSLNEKVFAVEHTGKLTALMPGSTDLLSKIYHSNGDLLCEAFATVKVGVPTSVKLNVQSDLIDINRQLPIYPMFAEGNLFTFYKLCKGYKWTVEDPQVINFRNDLKSETQLTMHDEVNMGFYQILLGRSAGRTQVSVDFTCNFTSSLYSHQKSYNASLSVLVTPSFPISLGSQMTWILPPYYTSSALLPSFLEPRREHERKVHKGTVIYSLIKSCGESGLLQHGSIEIDGDRIKTLQSGELACIQEKDRASGRSEIAVCLRVAEVAQVRMNNEDSIRKVIVAVGAQSNLQISFYDALGNRFREAYGAVHLEAETNHHDIVAVDYRRNGSDFIYLKGKKHGQALLRVVMDNNPLKADYILVSVGAHLQPENPSLQLGNFVHFFVEGSDEEAIGHWLCANKSVLSIDARSGKAEAVGVGSTQVIYETANTRLQTSVTVSHDNVLSLHAPNQIVTNIGDSLEGYRFFVKFSGTSEVFEDNGNDRITSFTCKVEPEFLGHAHPRRDRATNNFYCLFLPHSPEHLMRSESKLKGVKPYLSFAITASHRSSNFSASASSLFVGGFSVIDSSQTTKQLTLTSHLDKAFITIIGNTDVSVHWDKRNLVDVELIEREDYGFGGRARYEVKLLRDKKPYPVKDSISIVVPATGQKHVVEVSVDPPSSNTTMIGEALWSPIIIFVSLLVLVVAALVAMFEINKRSQQSQTRRSSTASSVPAPATPQPTRPLIVSDTASPATPQPFIDYVRKTIDETPYYRREPRRRFNIQNTM